MSNCSTPRSAASTPGNESASKTPAPAVPGRPSAPIHGAGTTVITDVAASLMVSREEGGAPSLMAGSASDDFKGGASGGGDDNKKISDKPATGHPSAGAEGSALSAPAPAGAGPPARADVALAPAMVGGGDGGEATGDEASKDGDDAVEAKPGAKAKAVQPEKEVNSALTRRDDDGAGGKGKEEAVAAKMLGADASGDGSTGAPDEDGVGLDEGGSNDDNKVEGFTGIGMATVDPTLDKGSVALDKGTIKGMEAAKSSNAGDTGDSKSEDDMSGGGGLPEGGNKGGGGKSITVLVPEAGGNKSTSSNVECPFTPAPPPAAVAGAPSPVSCASKGGAPTTAPTPAPALHPAPTSGGANNSHDACGNNTNSGLEFRVERDENTIKDHVLANTQRTMLEVLMKVATISPSSYLVMRGEVSVNVYYQTIETCQ